MPLIRHQSQHGRLKFGLAEDTIKNGNIMETVSGMFYTAIFLAKEGLVECIHHLYSARPIHSEWLLKPLHKSWDRVQLASVSNASTEMVGFGMVDVATRAIHSGSQNLHLQTAQAVFDQNDIRQLELLLAEILVSPDSLFGGHLPNVIGEKAKQGRDWEIFCKAAEYYGLKKVLTIAS